MPPNNRYERQLSDWWTRLNLALFEGALLIPPTILIADMRTTAGEWDPAKRTIRMSRAFLRANAWLTVVEVLKHEMAHQYVSDVLGVEDETSHGPAFRMICARYGICARASGFPRSPALEQRMDKIKKLLALGNSSNENEAKAALQKAKQLMRDSGVSEAVLDPEAQEFSAQPIGTVVKSIDPHQTRVSALLVRFFRVRCIWLDSLDPAGHPGKQLEILGRPEDLAVAEHVHGFLLAEADRRWGRLGISRQRDRKDFLEGVMVGFESALAEDERANRSHGKPGLVNISRGHDLSEFFDRRHPETSTLRRRSRRRGEKFYDGVTVGRDIELRKPMRDTGQPKRLASGNE